MFTKIGDVAEICLLEDVYLSDLPNPVAFAHLSYLSSFYNAGYLLILYVIAPLGRNIFVRLLVLDRSKSSDHL